MIIGINPNLILQKQWGKHEQRWFVILRHKKGKETILKKFIYFEDAVKYYNKVNKKLKNEKIPSPINN